MLMFWMVYQGLLQFSESSHLKFCSIQNRQILTFLFSVKLVGWFFRNFLDNLKLQTFPKSSLPVIFKILRLLQTYCCILWGKQLTSVWYDIVFPHSVQDSEAYSEPCQTCKMERFTKIVNGFYPLTIFSKHSIFDVW